MKRLLFACLLPVLFWGCKKTDTTLSPIEVQVNGLVASNARLNLQAIDVTQNNAGILSVINRDGDAIYSTAIVYPGDQINITYGAAATAAQPGDNQATITYYYKGQKIGVTSGSLSYPGTLSTTIYVPAQ